MQWQSSQHWLSYTVKQSYFYSSKKRPLEWASEHLKGPVVASQAGMTFGVFRSHKHHQVTGSKTSLRNEQTEGDPSTIF